MPQIIAGIYEIQEKIGAGGGGTVYIGKHLRLNKTIVLKADKRTLSAGTDALRREVDMLKGLSHTYIPQVYDFVQEDGVVYTVMDYIDGESMDKLLKRGERPAQPDVIRWACQLLEALDYLHKQPPYGILHGDIKPANIMLRPNGDICLIDFNIALALGEDGAVKVGFSRGYASPEHYGAEYINGGGARKKTDAEKQRKQQKADDVTQPDENTRPDEAEGTQPDDVTRAEDDRTLAEPTGGQSGSVSGSTTGKSKGVLLDVRSDIYSLGATLYHFLSGRKPAQYAGEVTPLGEADCSPAVAKIIQKAMDPDPDGRYQTAEEMLAAFLSLHETDRRMIRHKRHIRVTAAALAVCFLVGGAMAFIGQQQLRQRQEALALAEYSADALNQGNVSEAVSLALQAIPDGGIMDAPVTAQACKALSDALGVYQLTDSFQAKDALTLSEIPFGIGVSPAGTRFAVTYAYETAVYTAEDQERIAVLPMKESALADAVFAGEDVILYAGSDGVTAYDLAGEKTLWTGGNATMLALSGDGQTVAALDREGNQAVIYRVSDGSVLAECPFGDEQLNFPVNDIFADAGNVLFSLNEDGRYLAVSFAEGALFVYDLQDFGQSVSIYETSDYEDFYGGFCGDYFAYAANGSTASVFGIADIREGKLVGETDAQDPFYLKADENGIFLANGALLVEIDPQTMEQTELAYTDTVNITGFAVGETYALVADDENGFSFYNQAAERISRDVAAQNCDFLVITDQYAFVANRSETDIRILELENHQDAQLFTYDALDSHDEARVSGDGQRAVLFGYEGFSIYDTEGNLLAEKELPDADSIYDQQFEREDGSGWLEVIWYDGTVRRYSDKDGSLLSEEQGEAPEKDLYEEFETDRYIVTSSLHSAPEIYDKKTGKKLADLEQDDYLTYVTQVGEYLITEYVSAEGERYGLLLDKNLETAAYFPNLCDVWEETLVFDDKAGNLRQSRLYSLQELITLGESYINQ